MHPDLYPYQVTGARFLAERCNAALYDSMGVGKSSQAIAAADLVSARTVLLVCPAVARIKWQREWQRWQTVPRRTFVLDSAAKRIPEDAEVVITGQDLIARKAVSGQLLARRWDVGIFDEGHFAKNRTSLRAQAAFGTNCEGGDDAIISVCDRRWVLTGTPMPNDPSEIWTTLRALAPERIRNERGQPMSYSSFLLRFCATVPTEWGPKVVGVKNAAELARRMDGFFLRRLQEDVLPDLPPMVFSTLELQPDRATLAALGKLLDDAEIAQAVAVLEAALAQTGGAPAAPLDDIAIARLRRLVGTLKVKPVLELLRGELESYDHKYVVFAQHLDVLRGLFEGLRPYRPVGIAGRTPPAQRQRAIDAFQNDPRVRVFLGQIDATNSAIDLTAANQVVFAEPSFVPAVNQQAAKRAHRIGQTRPVFARMACLAGTLDEGIVRLLARKTAMVQEVMT